MWPAAGAGAVAAWQCSSCRLQEAVQPVLLCPTVVVMTCRRRLEAFVQERGPGNATSRLRWDGLKAFADGSLGSRTALMHQPYTDQPDTSGIRVTQLEELQQLITGADATGLQVGSP